MVGNGTSLGSATGDSREEKAEDTSADERQPERQQESSGTWDRGLRSPLSIQHTRGELHHGLVVVCPSRGLWFVVHTVSATVQPPLKRPLRQIRLQIKTGGGGLHNIICLHTTLSQLALTWESPRCHLPNMCLRFQTLPHCAPFEFSCHSKESPEWLSSPRGRYTL